MPDKIHLLLETILQEQRAASQEISNVKKDMVTHDVFKHHTETMTTKLNSISSEQNQQKTNIDSLTKQLSDSKMKKFTSMHQNKIGGVIFVLILAIVGLFVPPIIVKQNIATHSAVVAPIVSGQINSTK